MALDIEKLEGRFRNKAISEMRKQLTQDFKDKGWYNIPSLRHVLVKDLKNIKEKYKKEIDELAGKMTREFLFKDLMLVDKRNSKKIWEDTKEDGVELYTKAEKKDAGFEGKTFTKEDVKMSPELAEGIKEMIKEAKEEVAEPVPEPEPIVPEVKEVVEEEKKPEEIEDKIIG